MIHPYAPASNSPGWKEFVLEFKPLIEENPNRIFNCFILILDLLASNWNLPFQIKRYLEYFILLGFFLLPLTMQMFLSRIFNRLTKSTRFLATYQVKILMLIKSIIYSKVFSILISSLSWSTNYLSKLLWTPKQFSLQFSQLQGSNVGGKSKFNNFDE